MLSKKEFKHLTTIKTLRMKSIEGEKLQMDTQKKLDRVVADHTDAQAKVAKLMDENKQLNGECGQTCKSASLIQSTCIVNQELINDIVFLFPIQIPSSPCMTSTSARTNS